jgi:hypothetical protein
VLCGVVARLHGYSQPLTAAAAAAAAAVPQDVNIELFEAHIRGGQSMTSLGRGGGVMAALPAAHAHKSTAAVSRGRTFRDSTLLEVQAWSLLSRHTLMQCDLIANPPGSYSDGTASKLCLLAHRQHCCSTQGHVRGSNEDFRGVKCSTLVCNPNLPTDTTLFVSLLCCCLCLPPSSPLTFTFLPSLISPWSWLHVQM